MSCIHVLHYLLFCTYVFSDIQVFAIKFNLIEKIEYLDPILVFMSRPVWPAGHYVSGLSSFRPSVLPSFRPSRFRGTTLRAAPSKNYAFSTNYHACIAMPTWPRCAPPILCWPWPPYNLLPRSCLTWIFFLDPHWWAPLCVQCLAKAMPFQQISMHALQCQHDLDVHLLFCVDLDLHITSPRGRV